MKSLSYLSIPVLLLASCGDDASSSEIQSSVRARLPLYYEINSVEDETSKQNILGKELNASQLAINVVLKEDLYINSRLSEDLQNQLNQSNASGFGFGRHSTDKTFIKKVATKGETKTVYGEMLTSDLADGKTNIEDFRIKDSKGKPMSAYNESEVIIVGSPEEKAYVDDILAKRAEAMKLKEAEKAKVAEDKRLKEEAEKSRLASIAAEEAKVIADKKALIIETFAEGKTYEGAYILSTGEEVAVTVSKFDAQFLHGNLEVKRKENDLKVDIKFAFKLSTPRYNKAADYEISGKNEPIAEISRELIKASALAANARYQNLKLNNFDVVDDSIVLSFGKGKLMLKK